MTGEPAISSQYSATFGVSWELDLFGRLRSALRVGFALRPIGGHRGIGTLILRYQRAATQRRREREGQ
jgi:hypothetical protein